MGASASGPDAAVERQLLDVVTASWKSQAVRVAAELGIAELLADGPRTSAEVARAAGADEGAVHRLLRALTTIDLLREGPDGLFELTPMGAMLPSVRSWAIWWGGYVWAEWEHLLHSVRTGKAARPLVSREDGFKGLERDPDAAATFHEAMAELTALAARSAVENYDFSSFASVVDVGGGYGELLAAVLRAHPALEGILFDLPHTRAGARRLLEEAGVADRCQLVSGDFFEAVPGGADAYVLKSVIHDWDDRHAARILATCRRAMPAEATILLIERVVPDRLSTSVEHQSVARSDLHMLVAHGARERTEGELRALLGGSGFELVRVLDAGMGLSLLEAVPARGGAAT